MTRTPLLNGNYQWSEAKYDALGHLWKTSLPCLTANAATSCAAQWSEFTYDLMGRVAKADRPGESGRLISTIDYDGLVTTVADPLGRQSSRLVDVTGRLRRSTDANEYYQDFVYDSAGSLLEVTELPQGSRPTTLFSASYMYGIGAFQVSSNDRALGATTRFYDGLGQLRRWTDAKGQLFEATYDPLSRLAGATRQRHGCHDAGDEDDVGVGTERRATQYRAVGECTGGVRRRYLQRSVWLR